MPISSLARLHDLANYSGCGRRARPHPAAPLIKRDRRFADSSVEGKDSNFGPPRTGADFYSDVCSEGCRRKGWGHRFESALLQGGVRCEPSYLAGKGLRRRRSRSIDRSHRTSRALLATVTAVGGARNALRRSGVVGAAEGGNPRAGRSRSSIRTIICGIAAGTVPPPGHVIPLVQTFHD
jgi:hypothetical protein